MALGKFAKFGIGVAGVALVATASLGFSTPPTELPTVTVYHNPT